jgi:hypothetical protein
MNSPALSPGGLPSPARARAARRRLAPLALLLLVATGPARAADLAWVGGVYENAGTVVEATPAHDGPVSLRALLSLELDLTLGAHRTANITAVEIEQEDRKLVIRTKDDTGRVEWSGEWRRNGAYEPTKEGVKLLLRTKRQDEDFFMFTLSPVNEGAALAVKVERIRTTARGPTAEPVGTFLFLRTSR